MIIAKYRRRGSYAYVPHVDILRAFCMAIRRSRVDIAFSEGFNPHMQLKLSSPAPIGVESDCEYLAAASGESPENFEAKLNATLPEELRILRSAFAERPNPAAQITAAGYEIYLPGFDCRKLAARVAVGGKFAIEYTDKGEKFVKEVGDRIYSVAGDGEKLLTVLGYGANNLRADRLAAFLCGGNLPCEAEILKKKMYTIESGKLIDADKVYFDGTI